MPAAISKTKKTKKIKGPQPADVFKEDARYRERQREGDLKKDAMLCKIYDDGAELLQTIADPTLTLDAQLEIMKAAIKSWTAEIEELVKTKVVKIHTSPDR